MKRVTLERQKKGWSQARLAREVGCNATSVSRMESGKEPPYPKRGARIAAALGWNGPIEELFADVEGE